MANVVEDTVKDMVDEDKDCCADPCCEGVNAADPAWLEALNAKRAADQVMVSLGTQIRRNEIELTCAVKLLETYPCGSPAWQDLSFKVEAIYREQAILVQKLLMAGRQVKEAYGDEDRYLRFG